MRAMLAAYRATGADPPFGDPRGYHGVGMEGHFWRITQPRTGAVVIVIVAICRDAHGRRWAMVLTGRPPRRGSALGHAARGLGGARGLALRARRCVRRRRASLRVDLGPDARLEVELRGASGVAATRVDELGPAQAVPGLSQYWHPWLLRRAGERQRARRRPRRSTSTGPWRTPRRTGGRRDAAHLVVGAGARLRAPRRVRGLRRRARRTRAATGTATALVVAVGDEVLTVVRPLRPLRVAVDERGWRLGAARGVEVEAQADGAAPHLLPVPSHASAGASTTGAPQHLTGRLRLSVRRRGRTLYEGTSLASPASSAAAAISASRAAGSAARPSRCRRGR